MKVLRTPNEVVEALGGVEEVCKLTGSEYSSVWNWYGRRGSFPADWYAAMHKALRAKGFDAPPNLWRQKGV